MARIIYPVRTRVKSVPKVEAQLWQVGTSGSIRNFHARIVRNAGPTSTRLFHRKYFLTFRFLIFDFSPPFIFAAGIYVALFEITSILIVTGLVQH